MSTRNVSKHNKLKQTYFEAPPFDQAADNQRDDLAAEGDTEDETEHDEEGAEVLVIEGVACPQVPRAGRGTHDAAVGADVARIRKAGIRVQRVLSIVVIR